MLSRMKSSMTIERPLPKFQLLALVNSVSMTFPISSILLPPRMLEMTKVVSAGTKTIVTPLTMPGTESGSHMRKRVWSEEAPRSRAASTMLSSILHMVL